MMHKSIKALILCLAVLSAAAFLPAQDQDPGQKLLAQSNPGVLFLISYDKEKKEIAKGSAVVLTKELAVTNYHLVSPAASVVGFNYKKKEVDVLGIVAVDKTLDLALIKIDGKAQPLVPVADSLEAKKKIMAVGANESGDIIVSSGEIRTLYDLGGGVKLGETALSVPETFAGSAVFTEDGKFIGLMTILDRRLRFVVPAAAITALDKAGKLQAFKTWTPDDYAASLESAWLSGRLYAWMDESYTAQRNLEKVSKAQPDNLEAWNLLASVYFKQRDFSNAVTAYKKIIELDPNSASAYLGLGDVQVRMQKPQEAAPNLEKALALDPEKKEALMFLGNAYQDAREWAKAADAYEKFLGSGPANAWMIYKSLADCRLEGGEFDKAAAAYGEASKAQPDDQSILYKQAQAFERGGKPESAETIYKKLAELSPKDAINYYRGILSMYDKANNSPKAIEAAKKVVELNPKDELSHYNLGFIYQKMLKYPEAIAGYKKAIEVKPAYDYAWFQLGYCYYMQKNYPEALNAFKKNVEVVPDNFYGWLYIGMCHMQSKQYSQAMDPMKKAADLKPDDGTALFNLGIIYLNLKDKFSAQEVAKKLQTIDPNLAAKLRSYIK
jgi:tetratricopeptide (TPR) repeat protein